MHGVPVCSASGVDTSDSGNGHANNVVFGYNVGSYDDIYILDGTSPGQNDFLGEMKVEKGMPTSDSSVQWSRSGGSNNYETVDESPVSEADYIYSKTQNDVDLFGVTPVGTPNIKGAMLTVDTILTLPGGKELVLLCDSGGTQQTKSSQIGESDTRVAPSLVTDIDPDTLAAWTQTGINAAKWGVKVG